MRRPLLRPALALMLALGAVLPLAAQGQVATAPTSDYAALVGPFPPVDSDAGKADQAILLWLQRTRTEADVQRARSEVIIHLGVFSEVLGQDLDSGRYAQTLALGEQARKDLGLVTGSLKLHFARPRPYVANPLLKPAVQLEPSLSYPSGHSTWGMVEASILARLVPQREAAILARGRQVGYDRAIAGVHYPSDVDAGQRLGEAFAAAWLADPAHLARVEQVRAAEW